MFIRLKAQRHKYSQNTSSKKSKKNVAPIQSNSSLVKTNFYNRVKWQSIIVFSFPQAFVGYVILLQF